MDRVMNGYEWRLKYDPNQPRVPAGDPRGGQWTSAGGGSSQVQVRAMYDRADRANPGRIRYRAETANERLSDYPESVREELGDIDIVVASDQFLPADVAGAGGGYLHKQIWLSNSFSERIGNRTLDHEVAHALMEKFGPRFAQHWHDVTGERLGSPDVEEDAADAFVKYVDGSGGEEWRSWFEGIR